MAHTTPDFPGTYTGRKDRLEKFFTWSWSFHFSDQAYKVGQHSLDFELCTLPSQRDIFSHNRPYTSKTKKESLGMRLGEMWPTSQTWWKLQLAISLITMAMASEQEASLLPPPIPQGLQRTSSGDRKGHVLPDCGFLWCGRWQEGPPSVPPKTLSIHPLWWTPDPARENGVW